MTGSTEQAAADAKAAFQCEPEWQMQLCNIGDFPASLPLTEADAAVQAKFGKACQSIVKLRDMRFKEAGGVYLCRAFLNRSEPEAAVLEVFPKEQVDKADILAQQGMMGTSFAAVVLTDAKGVPDALILRRTVLEPLLLSLDSSAAAAAWAYLTGVTGEGFRTQNLCRVSLSESEEGWRFDNAEAFANCSPLEQLSFTVSKTGKVAVLSRAEKKNADGTVTSICVD